ncbi:Fic family protein [Listeria grandensis]|uniref:Fic family protein n=1 Tax=Listeria grandensis TaxID=1494963 RepID=UPI00164D27A0|nr:Fic family protein [Listeria grandensis]MBC6314222.1 Fic family protein [Listeria grandensis]
MTKYYPLKKIFHQDEQLFKTELNKRQNGYGSFLTSLEITPIVGGAFSKEKVNLFLVNIPELMKLYEDIMKNSKIISLKAQNMPTHALQQYMDSLLINELQSTNEIEGVRSSKKEIAEAIEELNSKKDEKKVKRFIGLVKLYQHIGDYHKLNRVEQFREIYDELVADEIEAENCVLDGNIFRKSFVGVTKNGEFMHKGVEPETRIIDYLNRLLNFLENDEMPDLYKYMIAHYYFEYIHPFYDGNGRTGRYLVCSLVHANLDMFSSVTFSYVINRHRDEYYKSFEEASNPLNQGEMTFFCMKMLTFLLEGQERIIDDMEEKESNLNRMEKSIGEIIKIDPGLKTFDYSVFYLISQSWLFSRKLSRLSNKDIAEALNVGRKKVDTSMQKLIDRGYLTKVRNNPIVYTLDQNCAQELLSQNM